MKSALITWAGVLHGVDDKVETLAVGEWRVKLRAGIDRGSWQQKGDAVCAALAKNERPVVLAIDELPILVNRMLKDHNYRITPGGKQDVDEFLSWLRKNGQDYRDRICFILSGSVGLEPFFAMFRDERARGLAVKLRRRLAEYVDDEPTAQLSRIPVPP